MTNKEMEAVLKGFVDKVSESTAENPMNFGGLFDLVINSSLNWNFGIDGFTFEGDEGTIFELNPKFFRDYRILSAERTLNNMLGKSHGIEDHYIVRDLTLNVIQYGQKRYYHGYSSITDEEASELYSSKTLPYYMGLIESNGFRLEYNYWLDEYLNWLP